jgi:hypothetical protein
VRTLTLLLASFLAVSCAREEPDPFPNGMDLSKVTRSATVSPELPRFNPAAVEQMRKRLLAGGEVLDLVYSPNRIDIEWQLGTVPRSDGLSFARDVCRQLREASLSDADTDVRVVDIAALDRHPGNFRAASLGHVRCDTGDSLGA